MRDPTLSLAAGLLAMLVAHPAGAQSDKDKRVSYVCEDGRTPVMLLGSDQEQIVLELDGEPHTLAQEVSGSGARYSDGSTLFWIKGREATLEDPIGANMTVCQAQD